MARTYNLSDPRMVQFSSAYVLLFLDHLPEFSDLDPDFNPAFVANWQSAIQASIAVPTEESRNDSQSGMTAKVLDVMRRSRLKYHEVAYFVRKAFPTDTAVQGRFGLNDYDRAANDQAVMRFFLHRMWDTAENEHKAALLTAGYTQARIDAIAALRDELGLEDSQQDHFSLTSPRDTDDRTAIHNHTWSFAQKVNDASKVAFAENIVLLNLFLFPRRTERPEVFNVLGGVSQSGTGNVLPDVAVSIPSLSIATTTDEDGNFGFAGIPMGSHMVTFEAAGHLPVTMPLNVVDPTTPTVLNAVLMPMMAPPPPPMP